MRYAPSTRFYLADEMAGMPSVTRLPHVVHVVKCIETYDCIGINRAVTRYTYNHGCFDGYEREVSRLSAASTSRTPRSTATDANFPEGMRSIRTRHRGTAMHTRDIVPHGGVPAGNRGFAPIRERILECAFPSRNAGVTGWTLPSALNPSSASGVSRTSRSGPRKEVYAEDGRQMPPTRTRSRNTTSRFACCSTWGRTRMRSSSRPHETLSVHRERHGPIHGLRTTLS